MGPLFDCSFKGSPEKGILPLEVSLTDTETEIMGCSLQSFGFQTVSRSCPVCVPELSQCSLGQRNGASDNTLFL